MRSRAVRLTLTLLAIGTVAVAAYLTWMIEQREGHRQVTAASFTSGLTAALRDVHELRGAQQAYVAAGQSESYWFDKVTSLSESLRASIGTLDVAAPSPATREAVAATTGALRTFDGVDRRARNYAATGQKLLASDIIFGDGLAATTELIRSLDQASIHAAAAGAATASLARREQLSYIAGAAGVLVLTLLLLTPAGTAASGEAPTPAADRLAKLPEPVSTLDLKLRGDDPPPVRREASAATVDPPRPAASPSATPAPAVELQALAAVCTDLARLSDTDTLPGILERTARALDASGLVLWVADFEGAELVPVATHGYPASVLSRLGTIRRDAENATGAAFRTGLVQTVSASGSAGGAIAAPLVTSSGCRGVMSAEVRGGAEKQPGKLAAAAIVAAQLAALVGPPPAATSQEREAAL